MSPYLRQPPGFTQGWQALPCVSMQQDLFIIFMSPKSSSTAFCLIIDLWIHSSSCDCYWERNLAPWKHPWSSLLLGHLCTSSLLHAMLRQWFRQWVKYFSCGNACSMRVVTPLMCPDILEAPSKSFPLHLLRSTFHSPSLVNSASVIASALISFNCIDTGTRAHAESTRLR